MKYLNILILFAFCSLKLTGQGDIVTIEGQILGYKGFKPVGYSINEYYQLNNGTTVKPDSLGRFVIKTSIKKTSFFTMNYVTEDSIHTCRLILEPGKHYFFISKGQSRKDTEHNYSPVIYTYQKPGDNNRPYYKFDLGQVYYNMIDNGTIGFGYWDQWNILKPDSLMPELKMKIHKQLSIFDALLSSGNINQEFYDIAKLNIEYTNAYRLAATIYSTWIVDRFKIRDTIVNRKLLKIYPRIFELYPVNKDVKFENHYQFQRYVDLYLTLLDDSKEGKFKPQLKKGASSIEPLFNSKDYLDEKAQKAYSQITTMNYMANYGLNSANIGRNMLRERSDLDKNTVSVIENLLLKKVDEFNNLSNMDFPENIVLLDKDTTINDFQQLLKIMENQAFIIDLWGTWCPPCRYQFQFQEKLKPFLIKNNIKIVYIAYEYDYSREVWKNFIKGYNLEGYHLYANDAFWHDMENYTGEIHQFPTYIIINKEGNVVENNAFFPSQTDKLINQLKEKLN